MLGASAILKPRTVVPKLDRASSKCAAVRAGSYINHPHYRLTRTQWFGKIRASQYSQYMHPTEPSTELDSSSVKTCCSADVRKKEALDSGTLIYNFSNPRIYIYILIL